MPCGNFKRMFFLSTFYLIDTFHFVLYLETLFSTKNQINALFNFTLLCALFLVFIFHFSGKSRRKKLNLKSRTNEWMNVMNEWMYFNVNWQIKLKQTKISIFLKIFSSLNFVHEAHIHPIHFIPFWGEVTLYDPFCYKLCVMTALNLPPLLSLWLRMTRPILQID